MKIGMIAVIVVMLLGGCSRFNPDSFGQSSTIDWVDFVKLHGKSYTGTFQSVIGDAAAVTPQVVGEVSFKVAEVVTNPSYRTKDGDAAFLDIGTKLYRVDGFDANELLASKDETRIGGYRLYRGDDFRETIRDDYKDVPKDKVTRIALYRGSETTPYTTLQGDDVRAFTRLLDGATEKSYAPRTGEQDPAYYVMVFYVNGPIAYAFSIADDGARVFFSPWNTVSVDDEIRRWIHG